jgi:hypothetical protein
LCDIVYLFDNPFHLHYLLVWLVKKDTQTHAVYMLATYSYWLAYPVSAPVCLQGERRIQEGLSNTRCVHACYLLVLACVPGACARGLAAASGNATRRSLDFRVSTLLGSVGNRVGDRLLQ